MLRNKMKLIYTNENIVLLHSAKNILALHDIKSFVKNEHVLPNGARHGINNIFLELWINHDKDFDKAASIIEKEIHNPEPMKPWICASCKEENDGSFDYCWNCQTDPSQ